MNAKMIYYENLANNLIERFNKRNIEGYYCANEDEAKAMAKRFLTPGCSISWGGSQTLDEIGLLDELHESDYVLYDRSTAKTPDEKSLMYSKTVTADYYFMSSNAISLDGQLINIDSQGNRIACLMAGPKHVIIIAGMNKIVTNVEDGIDRVRNMAAPPNAVRLGLKTPCAELGKCANCYEDDCICNHIVVTRRSKIPGRIKVILVGKELGY
ncbi:MAG TPA: lactate utilization protein [Clostridiales bacterium]|nr:lactate utilization protein [Clostridiales bacterium]